MNEHDDRQSDRYHQRPLELDPEAVAAAGGRGKQVGKQRYAFGDGDVAARRLALVARAFEPSSRAFLRRFAGRAPRLAVDLGCGPGHTTLLMAEVLRARRTIGLDQSARFVDLAGAAARGRSRGVAFAVHDVTVAPFPETPADVAYCRFLASHLADPAAALVAWATQLAPRGLLLLDEVEEIRTADPTLRAYLDAVTCLLAARRHRLEAGPLLDTLPPPPGLRRLDSRVVPLSPPAALVGEMFALNLAVWRRDPLASDAAAGAALDHIADDLAVLARGERPARITWGLRQLAFQADR